MRSPHPPCPPLPSEWERGEKRRNSAGGGGTSRTLNSAVENSVREQPTDVEGDALTHDRAVSSPPSPIRMGEGCRGGEGHTVGTYAPAIENSEFGRWIPQGLSGAAERAKELRKEATFAEAAVWEIVRSRRLGGAKFRRQHPIGRFIADFYCPEARLIVEIDGSIHDEKEQKERDAIREELLRSSTLHIVRFTNKQVLEIPEVVSETLLTILHQCSNKRREDGTPPSPILMGEGGRGGEG
jgi:very-short-patch-repair endonuclease